MLKKLYLKYKEIINYLIIGVLTTVVSLLSFYLVRKFILISNTQLNIQISNVISWIFAVLFAFVTNKKYVFESKEVGKNMRIEMIKFYISRLTTLFIDMLSMWILTDLIKLDDMISKILVQFIIVILNYIFSKLFVFKKVPNKNIKIKKT
mgnify:CR=1 FL=1